MLYVQRLSSHQNKEWPVYSRSEHAALLKHQTERTDWDWTSAEHKIQTCRAQYAGSILSNKEWPGYSRWGIDNRRNMLHVLNQILLYSHRILTVSHLCFLCLHMCTASIDSIFCQEIPYIVPFGHYLVWLLLCYAVSFLRLAPHSSSNYSWTSYIHRWNVYSHAT